MKHGMVSSPLLIILKYLEAYIIIMYQNLKEASWTIELKRAFSLAMGHQLRAIEYSVCKPTKLS